MSEAFLKALKWYIMVGFCIIGTSAFIIMDKTGSIKPLMIGVMSYGVVYIMTFFWTEFRRRLLLLSIIVFLVFTFASPYVPDLMFVFFNFNPDGFNPYYTWGGTMVLGIPFMALIFYKYD